jgi:hypothetical protein
LENIFEKKFSKPFKKLYLKPRCGFRKAPLLLYTKEFQGFGSYKPARSAGLCTRSSARARQGDKEQDQGFGKLYLKPRCGFRKASRFFISRDLNVLALTNSREARVCVRGRARARSSGAWGLKAPKVLPLILPLI